MGCLMFQDLLVINVVEAFLFIAKCMVVNSMIVFRERLCAVFNLFMCVKRTLLICNLCELISSHVFIIYGKVKIIFNTIAKQKIKIKN